MLFNVVFSNFCHVVVLLILLSVLFIPRLICYFLIIIIDTISDIFTPIVSIVYITDTPITTKIRCLFKESTYYGVPEGGTLG